MKYITNNTRESLELQIRRSQSNKILLIGEPKATDHLTTQQLKAMGMCGLYESENEFPCVLFSNSLALDTSPAADFLISGDFHFRWTDFHSSPMWDQVLISGEFHLPEIKTNLYIDHQGEIHYCEETLKSFLGGKDAD